MADVPSWLSLVPGYWRGFSGVRFRGGETGWIHIEWEVKINIFTTTTTTTTTCDQTQDVSG